jgi:hypothetical protein
MLASELKFFQNYIRADIRRGKFFFSLILKRGNLFKSFANPIYSVINFAIKFAIYCFLNSYYCNNFENLTIRIRNLINKRKLFQIGETEIQGRSAFRVYCVSDIISKIIIYNAFTIYIMAVEKIRNYSVSFFFSELYFLKYFQAAFR